MVGVCALFEASAMVAPRAPVERSTKFGTLPAAMSRLGAGPLTISPSRNCAWVHTEATVVISSIVTVAGGLPPSAVRNASDALSPAPLFTAATPPLAMR
jgi:hypothetical protein